MFEYQTLLEEPQYGENMEIYAGKKNNWTGEFSARFLLKLPVDFSNIPTYLLKDVNEDPGEDVALLSVSFEDTEATQVYPKLYLSPRIEHALGGSSALHIPAFPGGGCLIDYVPQVCHLLTNKVQYVIQGYHKRREYIAAFLSHFGTGVVEYDAEGFTKLTLLLMWKDFCFLVHIDLPLFFPRDQPTLTFQSVYHFTNSGQLYSQAQKNYPYSPRWDGNEMAKRANVQWTCVNASCNPVAIRSYLNYSREGLAEGPAEDAVDGMACGVTERCAPCFPGPTAQPGKSQKRLGG
ncbi:BRISC and BRCA1-A complex member 2 isoform X5 [Panthera leo]|nr:BRISC and BRCA1-A complex member 2 isoform X5 [Panthera leo]